MSIPTVSAHLALGLAGTLLGFIGNGIAAFTVIVLLVVLEGYEWAFNTIKELEAEVKRLEGG
jgi:hypothetical protein